MLNSTNKRDSIICAVLFVFALLLGFLSAAVWYNGYAPYTRLMVMFASCLSLIVILVTNTFIIVAAKRKCIEETRIETMKLCATRFSQCVFISAIVVVLVSLSIIATLIPMWAKVIFAITGCVSVWYMVLCFIAQVIYMFGKEVKR
ncbi:MAG: hypothetical protein A2Y17_05295 [Clostridiales bacterium GWF2_38_85]|nr:MAG: hypothetical protein A2Y17_05295 [Clostridiales bacterium GWF2_38_85]HBL83355.1 hypothetical protein [Clostridiales bacterium]